MIRNTHNGSAGGYRRAGEKPRDREREVGERAVSLTVDVTTGRGKIVAN